MLQRKYQNTRSYHDPIANLVYIHCLMRANIKPVIVQGVYLQPGQFLTSVYNFSQECGVEESKMRRILSKLEGDGLISKKSAGKVTDKVTNKTKRSGTIITVENYGVLGDGSTEVDEQTDEQTDEKSDEQTDEKTGNSIIQDTIYQKEETNDLQGCYGEGQSPKGDCLTSPLANTNFVHDQEAIRLADKLIERGFKYTGHGGGGFPGYISHIKKTGYTEKDILTAFDKMRDASQITRIDDHVAYLDTVLSAMYENGECERGFFLGDQKKTTMNDKTKEVVDYLLEHGFQYDQSGQDGLVETIAEISWKYGDDILWEAAEHYAEDWQINKDGIRNHINYLKGIAAQIYDDSLPY